MHVVPEQPAQIADSLVESARGAEGIRVAWKQQRMAALHAGVFHVAIASADRLVGVVAQETRERVTDSHRRETVGQTVRAASRACSISFNKQPVVDGVPPDAADQACDHSFTPPALEGAEYAPIGSSCGSTVRRARVGAHFVIFFVVDVTPGRINPCSGQRVRQSRLPLPLAAAIDP
jgi:hypothetical protein